MFVVSMDNDMVLWGGRGLRGKGGEGDDSYDLSLGLSLIKLSKEGKE